MLTDPFYDPAVKYSGNHVPVSEFEIAVDGYARAGTAIKELLESAGWTVVDSEPSYVDQWRPSWYFTIVDDPTATPQEMTATQCTSHFYPPWRGAIAGGLYFNFYDPYRSTPTCTGGTGDVRWVPAGTTTWNTAQNLATALTDYSQWNVTVVDNGSSFNFSLVSKSAAFENDELGIFIGGTLDPSTRGFYVLQSPALPTGGYMQAKIETDYVASGGYSFAYNAGIGTIRCVLTVTASGGGQYKQPIFPGSYYFAGSENQFLIIPRYGQAATRLGNSSILVSLIEAPTEHDTAGNCPVVIGSDNGSFTGNTDQVRKSLHWGINLASGHAANMLSTGWHAGTGVEWYQLVTVLVRGTVGRETTGRSGQPLIQAPYIAVPANPQSGAEAVIVGKLWDIILTSGNAQIGERMMYDTNQWICIGKTAESVDVYADMWTLAA